MTSEIFENKGKTPVEESIFEYLEEKGVTRESEIERRFAEEAQYDISKIREGLDGLEKKGDVYTYEGEEDTLYSSSLNELNERAVYGGANVDYSEWQDLME